jgi:ATP-dependent RNA helicase DeaD
MSDSPSAPAAPSFAALGLDARLARAVADLGFDAPTPIQAEALPVLMEGRDVVGGARTGSGKTAAFGLPLLQRVADGGPARALVLAPTRELALQVARALDSYATHLDLSLTCIYGGAPYGPQLRDLRGGATVVVGTPGRLLDHLDRGSLDLSGVEVVVLDEADEMLRMGFIDDVERLLEATPRGRQVALFSATMPAPIRRIAQAHLSDPVEVQVEEEALTVDHIEQRWIRVPQRHKLDALQRVLQVAPPGGTLVFARTRAGCAALADALAKQGVAADALHGDLSQSARERVLARLRAARLDVLVATDVAARGLDVDHLGLVINADLPDNTEAYVHRIGRTGRAGRKGLAISFITPRETRLIKGLERKLGVKLTPMDPPTDADIQKARRARLMDELERTVEGDLEAVRRWLAAEAEARGWDLAEVAAAAVARMAARDGVELDADPDAEPVAWSRGASRDRGRSEGAPDPANEVELFVPIGRRQGVRPGDLVGALANEAGIPGRAIGRITLFGKNSFVGMPRDAAEHVLANHPVLSIRGREVRLSMAHGTDGPRKRRQGERGGGGGGRDPRDRRGPRGKGRGSRNRGGQKRPRGRR